MITIIKDLKQELSMYQMKKLKNYEGQDIVSMYDMAQSKEITENHYKLGKKIYLGLDGLHNKQSLWTETIQEKNEENDKLREDIFELNKELSNSINSIVELCDQMTHIYNFAQSQNNEVWIDALAKVIVRNDKIISKVGLNRMQVIGEIFDSKIHNCVETEECNDHKKDEIIDVYREGYRYKSKVLRYPDVKITR